MLNTIKRAIRLISFLPFVVVLPAMWGATCYVEFFRPGDEYAMWGMASLPGVWIVSVIGNVGVVKKLLLPVVLTGIVVMAAVGFAMDRLRLSKAIWPWLYAAIAAFLLVYSIASYPSWGKAMSKNGSLTAYILFASNAAVYLAAVASLGIALIVKLRRTIVNRRKK